MRKFFLFLMVFISITVVSYSQALTYSFGFELNQTRFRQYAPTIDVPFKNPHSPGVGLCTYITADYQINKIFSLKIAPLIGFYNSKSKVTDSYQINIFGGRIEPILSLRRAFFSLGFEYNNFAQIYGTFQGHRTNFTWFAHRRNLFGPTVSAGYKIADIMSLYLRGIFFLKDFYKSGALDPDGNVIGPVKLTPYIFAFGIEFNLSKIVGNSIAGKYDHQ